MNLRKRFEILKRDGFRCRYCGADQTRSLLQVDHVHPVSKGGRNEDANLVTACFECNQGKKDRPLIPLATKRAESDEIVYTEAEHDESVSEHLDATISFVFAHYHKGYDHCGSLPPEIEEWAHILRSAGVGEWLALDSLLRAGDRLRGLTWPEAMSLLQETTLSGSGFEEHCRPEAKKLRETWPRLQVVK